MSSVQFYNKIRWYKASFRILYNLSNVQYYIFQMTVLVCFRILYNLNNVQLFIKKSQKVIIEKIVSYFEVVCIYHASNIITIPSYLHIEKILSIALEIEKIRTTKVEKVNQIDKFSQRYQKWLINITFLRYNNSIKSMRKPIIKFSISET